MAFTTNLAVCCDYFFKGAHAFCHIQLFQEFRKADIADFPELAAGCIPKSAGNISLSAATGSAEDDMVSIIDIFAGGKTQDLRFVQLPIREVLNGFNGSGIFRKSGIADKLV